MPPAASDNQGLKIAVAVFVTLSVMLAVATYFGFSNASYYSAKADEADKKARDSSTAQANLLRQFEELKELAGYPKVDDAAVATKIREDRQKLNDNVGQLQAKVATVYSEYKSVAGATVNQQADKFATSAQTITENIVNEPNRTLASTVSRLVELMESQSQLLAAVSADYQATRKELENSNAIAQQKVDVEVAARDKFQQDHISEQSKYEEDRRGQLNRMDELQTRNQELLTENNDLKNQLAQAKDEADKKYGDLMTQFKALREEVEKKETVLDSADGVITYVDYSRNEVHTSLSRRQGAREQMVFTVFDKSSPGIPTDKPKAIVELVKVDDNGSVGRIVEQMRTADPLRKGDQVASPAFGDRPQTFALIGKVDVDRDGNDDRQDLIRMITSAGGQVVFDLPPPPGRQTGELTPLTSWYVLDDRQPWRPGAGRDTGATVEEVNEFNKKKTEALNEARLAGVRPISLDRLLVYLGYRFGRPSPGRVEAIDRQATERLLNPRGLVPNAPKPDQAEPEGGDQPAPEGEEPKF